VSRHTHILVYFHRPMPSTPELGLYHEETQEKEWGHQKTHPADKTYIPSIKLQSDYFKQTEEDAPEDSHFTLWLTHSNIAIDLNEFSVTIPSGTPVCLNPVKTSIGVQKGQVQHGNNKLISYPKAWIHPLDKHIDWGKLIMNGTLQQLPEVAQMPHTMNTPPDFD